MDVLSLALGINLQKDPSNERIESKNILMQLIDSAPQNSASSQKLTDEILAVTAKLESQCPSNDQDVFNEINGNWILQWTAQDRNSDELKQQRFPLQTWINPLENQSYSNKNKGRSNPILPLGVQERLENLGILSDTPGNPVKSSQAINLQKKTVRNVVTFETPKINIFPVFSQNESAESIFGSVIVDVNFEPNPLDQRRIDVKFKSCRIKLQKNPILDFTIPLGIIGPTGWLRTTYVDEDIRITRGHKGSVFVLSRTSKRSTYHFSSPNFQIKYVRLIISM